MRTDLFSAIVRQDIEFFDRQRTGEIVNRLTSDVQDFKSSFKQVVSSGLRAGAQIVGCTISLILISPKMTFITLICVPSIIVVGTAVGSVLRSISREAQAQVRTLSLVTGILSPLRFSGREVHRGRRGGDKQHQNGSRLCDGRSGGGNVSSGGGNVDGPQPEAWVRGRPLPSGRKHVSEQVKIWR